MERKIEVGILGATGMVGQQFMLQLDGHPWFDVTWLGASQRSEGRRYADAAPWRLATPMPAMVRDLMVEAAEPGRGSGAPRLVFSALDSSVAGDIEAAFAAAGHIVVSNAKNYRMDPVVPLLIPEINPEHLALLSAQSAARGWTGRIVTNPNCSTVVLSMVLAPLRRFGLRRVMVTTLQAVSGAGYPGVASLDILGNVIPFIDGEEEKMRRGRFSALRTTGSSSRTTSSSAPRRRACRSQTATRNWCRSGSTSVRRKTSCARRWRRSRACRSSSACRRRRGSRSCIFRSATGRSRRWTCSAAPA